MAYAQAIPFLLSFLVGLLIGMLVAGLLPAYSRIFERTPTQNRNDSLVWFLLLAAFTFGVLVTIILGSLP